MFPPPPQFTESPDSITAQAERLVEHTRHLQDELIRNIEPQSATFTHVMLPLAYMDANFYNQSNMLSFYHRVFADEQIQKASKDALKTTNNFLAESLMRTDIFELIDAVRKRGEDLDEESARLLQSMYDGYMRAGVEIQDPTKRRRFREIEQRLGQLGIEYRENLSRDASVLMSFTAVELEGVPESILSRFERSSPEDQYRVRLSNDDCWNILIHANDSSIRERVYIAYDNRHAANGPLLKEALMLRHERAELLGFRNHAAFQLNDKMAKTPETANHFLADLQLRLKSSGINAVEELIEIKKSHLRHREEEDSSQQNNRLFLWDHAFYTRIYKSKQPVPVDNELIREYFPTQNTIASLLNLAQSLFGLEITELLGNDKPVVWNQDVKVFRVQNDLSHGDVFLGYLYFDIFQRLGKKARVSCHTLQRGFIREDGSRQHPISVVFGNYAKETTSSPSLLKHFDVVNLFHEIGHALNDMVSKTKYSRFHGSAGVNVDFGELPSQMLEQWCWEPAILKLISCHYSHLPDMLEVWSKTNPEKTQPEKHMPDTLIQAFLEARYLSFGPSFYLDQLQIAIFDMIIHQASSVEEVESFDLAAIWNKLGKDLQPIDGPEVFAQDYSWGHGYCSLSHLMSEDYTAGYYSYLYSEVYATDLFQTKFSASLMDSEVAKDYRKCVLEKGGSRDPMHCLVDFLGRQPSANAFQGKLQNLSLSS